MAKSKTKKRSMKKSVKKSAKRRTTHVPSLDVKSLGQMSSLKTIMKNHPVILVLVYADWCGHCQHFKPEWKSLTNLPSRNVPMVSIRDDVFNASPLNTSLKVEGYPTVAVVNTKQNISVNVPNREKNTLTKLLSNASNLSSPPPPGANLNNLNEEINIIRNARSNKKPKSFNNIMNNNIEPMEANSLNENIESIGSFEPESEYENSININMEGGGDGLFDIIKTYSASKA